MRSDFDPFLPRPAIDPASLHLLRSAAVERVKREEQALLGGVPAVPGHLLSKAEVGVVSRRWSLGALFALLAGAVPAVAVSSSALRSQRQPKDAASTPQAAVYGGPVPRPGPAPPPPVTPPKPNPPVRHKHKHHAQPQAPEPVKPAAPPPSEPVKPPVHPSAAPLYGGPTRR